MDIDIYEEIIQASTEDIETHVSTLWFDEERGFGHDFNPVQKLDHAWQFVDYFDSHAPWWEAHRFYVYLSLVLKQQVEPHFRLGLSNLTKMNICKAAVLAKLDPLKFDEDRKRVIREAQEGIPKRTVLGFDLGSLNRMAAAVQATSVQDKESPFLQAVNEKIQQLDDEERQWRAGHDIPV